MPTAEVLPDSEELLQQVADALLKSRKVVVITGAGISTNSGIPDFRSENGLYSLIQAQFDAANKLRDLQAGDPDILPETIDLSEPPPTKRRRLSYDLEPTLSTVDVVTTPLCEADAVVAGPQNSGQEKIPAENVSEAGTGNTFVESPTSTNPSSTTQDEQISLALPQINPSIQSVQPTTLHPSLRSALPASAYTSSSSHELSTVQVDAPLTTLCLLQGSTAAGAALSSTNIDHRQPRRIRAASTPPVQYGMLDEEFPPPPLRRARSASPPRREGDCHASCSRSSPQDPYLTPQRYKAHIGTSPPLTLPPVAGLTASSSRFKASLRTPSRFTRGPRGFNSSPLSSPPPVLFDPYRSSSSSTSHRGSSEASSSASPSETEETPPSSMPSLSSQTSNPSRTSLPNLKGRDLFDVSIWSDPVRTSVFYTFTTTLRQKSRDVQPTASHHFISHLRDRGKLVRCYTQNIDQIEEKVGLSTSLQQGPGSRGRFSRRSTGGFINSSDTADGKDQPARRIDSNNGGVECVFLHGSLQSLRCFLCGQVCEWDEDGRHLETLSGRQPECPHCAGATAARQERGKRALGVGKLRPDIVLYGEEHPNAHLIDPLVKHDLGLYPDFMLILGTSLKVHGLKVIVREFAKAVHCKGGKVVFVNFTKPPESSWGDIIDYWVRWDCDAWVANLQQRIPLLWLPPGTKLPAPPKRKRENPGVEKPPKKRPGLSKQGSSIVVQPLVEPTATEGSITVLGPAGSAEDSSNASTTEDPPLAGPISTDHVGTVHAVATDVVSPQAKDTPVLADVQMAKSPVAAVETPADEESTVEASTAEAAINVSERRTAGALAGPTAAAITAATTPEVSTAGANTPELEATAAGEKPASATSPPKTPKAPSRPMSLREDKVNGAYLTWQVTRDLRRLSGNNSELLLFSSPIVRVKPVRTPRSAEQTTPQSAEQTTPQSVEQTTPQLAEQTTPHSGTQSEAHGLPLHSPTVVSPSTRVARAVTAPSQEPEIAPSPSTALPSSSQLHPASPQFAAITASPLASTQADHQVPSGDPAAPCAAATLPAPSVPPPRATKRHRKFPPLKKTITGGEVRRQARNSLHLLLQSAPANPQEASSGDAKPAATTARRGKKGKRGPGWVYMPEDAPEAQALQMRQAMNSGVNFVQDAEGSAQSIYAAIKSNPRHRKRKVIDGIEVSLTSARAPRRSLPASMPRNAHSTAIFQLVPEPNEILPLPVVPAQTPNETGPDKENHNKLSPQILSDINRVSMHSFTLAPIQPRPLPPSIQAQPIKPQPVEPPSPPPAPPTAMSHTVGTMERKHPLGHSAFAISDSLLYQLSSPRWIWTPEDQLREEAALALSDLRTRV